MSHGTADAGLLTPQSTFYDEGRFGRLFPTLPPFAADTPPIRDALSELGRPGGPMDAAGRPVRPGHADHRPGQERRTTRTTRR